MAESLESNYGCFWRFEIPDVLVLKPIPCGYEHSCHRDSTTNNVIDYQLLYEKTFPHLFGNHSPESIVNNHAEQEWRSKELNGRLEFVYKNKLFTDIKLVLYFGGKVHEFMAHKNILAHYSPVFEDIFYGQGSQEMPPMDPQGLSYVLKMMYRVPPSPRKYVDRSILLSAYHSAKTLIIREIELELKQEILNDVLTYSLITKDDFWKIFELSRILGLDDITERLLRFAESNSKAVLRAKSMVKASPCTLMAILDLDMLKTSEKEVLDAIVRWKEKNQSLPFVQEFLQDLLRCVRFQKLEPVDLCQIVANKSHLIDRDDILKIMMYHADPNLTPLPDWCSTKSRCSTVSQQKGDQTNCKPSEARKSMPGSTSKNFRSSHLLPMYLEQKYTDICFIVGTEQKRLRAHRSILAVGSLVFEKMFFSPLAYNHCDMVIPGHDPKGFENMLMYFYDDSRPETILKRNGLIDRVFYSAVKYGSLNIIQACLELHKPVKMTLKSFWQNLNSAAKKQNPIVLRQYFDHATKHTRELLSSPDFLEASREAVISIFKLDKLGVEEIEVLESAAKWLEKNSESEQFKYDILRLIRFGNITIEQFCDFLRNHGNILPANEIFSIQLHLHDKESPLPAWCHNGPARVLAFPPPYE